ncbi:MAG: helix-turn-helix transcriptional regulator [Sulfuricurvum sp.]|nr:helix-turn-helix transcriptional regulator [Sulfuricurvum sp.]
MNNRLKLVQSCLGLSKTDLAKTLKIAKQTYYKMERGENNINVDVLTRLYKEHKVNPIWMMTGEGSMFVHLGISSENKLSKILSDADAFGIDIEMLLSKHVIEKIFQKIKLTNLSDGYRPVFILRKILLESNYLPGINNEEAKRYLIEKIHTLKEISISLNKIKGMLLFEIEKLTEEECKYLLLYKSKAFEEMKKITGKINWKAEELLLHRLF